MIGFSSRYYTWRLEDITKKLQPIINTRTFLLRLLDSPQDTHLNRGFPFCRLVLVSDGRLTNNNIIPFRA